MRKAWDVPCHQAGVRGVVCGEGWGTSWHIRFPHDASGQAGALWSGLSPTGAWSPTSLFLAQKGERKEWRPSIRPTSHPQAAPECLDG